MRDSKKKSFGSKLVGLFKKDPAKDPFKSKLSQINATNNQKINKDVDSGKQQIV